MTRDDSARDYSIVGRALEGMETVIAKEEAIRSLQDERKLLRDSQIQELAEMLRELPLTQVFEVASDVYWSHPQLGDIAKKAYVAATRHGLVPQPMATEVECSRCGNLVTASSWTQYNSIMTQEEWRKSERNDHVSRSLCVTCRQAVEEQRHRQQEADFRSYREKYETGEAERERQLVEFRTMPKTRYEESDHWRLLSQAAVKRAEYRCQLCNSRGVLQVRSRTDGNRGQESITDLVVLCVPCHDAFQLIDELR